MSTTPAETPAETSPEYQHYIPQFLLRNFAHPYQRPNSQDETVTDKEKKKKQKKKHEKGMFPGDPVLNCVNLKTDPFELDVRPVKRAFGLNNMYDDKAKATTAEQRRIEKQFGQMESRASEILRRIVKTQEAGEATGIKLTRIDRDVVRKFLFLLLYRGQGFHDRFDHDTADDYCANDRKLILEYMREKGFRTPLDVWFHNLEAIMDVKMTPGSSWTTELYNNMYPPDANWFKAHAENYYMALCTPAEDKEEFVLTDVCFSVFEGPNTFMRDAATGEIIPGPHAGYHYFAPISPRLMILLRSDVLPHALEDAHPGTRHRREDRQWSAFGQTFGPNSESRLADLPVHKAQTSYAKIIDGAFRLNEGFDGKYRSNDTFTFPFFHIEPRHVMIMNNTLLDNAYECTAIAFRTRDAFFRVLESYVAGPCDSAKVIGGPDMKQRVRFIRSLWALAKSMGSKKPLSYVPMEDWPTVDAEDHAKRQDSFMLLGFKEAAQGKTGREIIKGFVQIYADLEGLTAPEVLPRLEADVSRSGQMAYREHVAVTSNMDGRQPEDLRVSYQSVNIGLFWLYIKQKRRAAESRADSTQDFVDFFSDPYWQNGPEDTLAKAHQLFPEKTLKRLMQVTLDQYLTSQSLEVLRLRWQRMGLEEALFSQATHSWLSRSCCDRSITDCGVPIIEAVARSEYLLAHLCISSDRWGINSPENEEAFIELTTRESVKAQFRSLLQDDVEAGLLVDLEEVFFNFTFPIPPVDHHEVP